MNTKEILPRIKDSLKKPPYQLTVDIRENTEESSTTAVFSIPVFTSNEESFYLLKVKKPSFESLRLIISKNKNEFYGGTFVASLKVNNLEAGRQLCEELVLKAGAQCFLPLAKLDLPDYTQHLFWAGKETLANNKISKASLVSDDEPIAWQAESRRIKDELKNIVLEFLKKSRGSLLESLTIHAVEHVELRINGIGPKNADYFNTNIYTMDIENFIQENGPDEYHKCIKTAIKILKKDPELKKHMKSGFSVNLECS